MEKHPLWKHYTKISGRIVGHLIKYTFPKFRVWKLFFKKRKTQHLNPEVVFLFACFFFFLGGGVWVWFPSKVETKIHKIPKPSVQFGITSNISLTIGEKVFQCLYQFPWIFDAWKKFQKYSPKWWWKMAIRKKSPKNKIKYQFTQFNLGPSRFVFRILTERCYTCLKNNHNNDQQHKKNTRLGFRN